MSRVDWEQAKEEFALLKAQEMGRNYNYFLLRQALKGNYRWPTNWPNHIPKVTWNHLRQLCNRHVSYFMGKGFDWNINRPSSLEWSEAAERAEKILRRVLELSKGDLQFIMGAKTGSELGRTVYKVYRKGEGANQHACFTYCEPEYFYGVPSSDSALDDFSTVYYSYPLDLLEAERRFGKRDYRTEGAVGSRTDYYDARDTMRGRDTALRMKRNVPVLEVWTKNSYALEVGGIEIYNGELPKEYRWADTKDGFIPFVVIENVRNSEAQGEADIHQSRELNEQFNWLFSRQLHNVNRWLQPTVVWEGAPQNFAEVLTATLSGGGALPTRLGSRLYLLSYDRDNPLVAVTMQQLREAILESAGMNEVAMWGELRGSINTGPSTNAQFRPTDATVEEKRTAWSEGLSRLFAMLLNVQESIGDSKALGSAVINQTVKSLEYGDGEEVPLSGKDIRGLRSVEIMWPGVLPKDDVVAAQFELEKADRGYQSIYTTLERLGVEYPDDELNRIRQENTDSALRGDKVAEQTRAQAPLMNAETNQMKALFETLGGPGGAPPPDGAMPGLPPPPEEIPELEAGAMPDDGIGARLRELSRNAGSSLNMEGDEPVIEYG